MKLIWEWLKIPAARWGLIIGIAGTAVFLGGFTVVVERTNTLEFCVSCHSMTFPYEEYKKSFHYKNNIGVRAICADCHVPKDYPAKLIAKVMAAKDVYHEILGTVSTKEKYEEHRLKMAQAVWAKMEARESKECRTCHDFDSMMIDEQGRRARRKHAEAVKEGQHCINCHKGVVHELPRDYDG